MPETLRVIVFGKNREEILPAIERLGIAVVEDNPDVVISYGGDGTLLMAEREWPSLPKVALRDSKRCLTCTHHDNGTILRHLAEGKLKRTEFIKLDARLRRASEPRNAEGAGNAPPSSPLSGINDINLHKATLNAGVRYRIWIDDEPYGGHDEIVGDGLVVSTPFGSAAYYRSITNSTFRTGIGLAFNNTTEPISHLVLREDSVIRVLVTRGPAQLAADNNPTVLPVRYQDEILIQRAPKNAIVLAYDKVRYPADQFIF